MATKVATLTILFLLPLYIAVVNASELIINEADSQWKASLEVSEDLIRSASGVTPRIAVQFSNSIYSTDLNKVPENFSDLVSELISTRRLIINRAESSRQLTLISPHEFPKGPIVHLPQMVLSGTSYDFGEVSIDSPTSWSLMLFNTGDATLEIGNIASDNSAFTLPSPDFPQNISLGDSLEVTVTFLPTEEKSYSGNITITSNDPDEDTVSISLIGVGISAFKPNIGISVSSYNFGEIEVNASSDFNLILSNLGNTALSVESVVSDSEDFQIISPVFPQNIAPEDSIVISVRFSPSSEEDYSGILTVTSNDPDQAVLSITLTGKGMVLEPDLKIHLISFPDSPVAMKPSTVQLKIINDGSKKSSPGNLQVALCILRENLEPFEGDVIDVGKLENIKPGEVITLSFPYTFISNAYSKYLDVTIIPEAGMDANLENNFIRIDFFPLPNINAYLNCVGEITTIMSLGLLGGQGDLKFAKDLTFFVWDKVQDSYGLSGALQKGDVKKVITIFAELAWDSGKEIFRASGRALIGKLMSYVKLAYSMIDAARNEGRFLGCGEVVPRAWETLKELPEILWERIRETGESVFYFLVDSPADIIVEDSKGFMTSVTQAGINEGIKNSFGIEFENHKAVIIIGSDVYTVRINGIETGECGLTVFKPTETGDLAVISYERLPTEANSRATVVVGQDITDYTVHIDKNGDGTVDETRNPDTLEGTTPPTGDSLKNENVYAYPNPFNPDRESATFRFSLSTSAVVTVKLYDTAGRQVITLTDGEYIEAEVEQSLMWDGRNDNGGKVANGVYFYVIESSAGEKAIGKVAVLQ